MKKYNDLLNDYYSNPLNIEKAVTNIKYYTWPAEDLSKEKKEIVKEDPKKEKKSGN